MSLIVQSPPTSTTSGRMTSRRRFAPAWLWIAAAGVVALPCASALAQLPGAESFVRPLKTPLDFWEVSDYLVRTEQIKAAVPFLTKFESRETGRRYVYSHS